MKKFLAILVAVIAFSFPLQAHATHGLSISGGSSDYLHIFGGTGTITGLISGSTFSGVGVFTRLSPFENSSFSWSGTLTGAASFDWQANIASIGDLVGTGTYSFLTNLDGKNLFAGLLYMNNQKVGQFAAFVTTTPLPAALPMFGAALAGLGLYRRRKAVKAA